MQHTIDELIQLAAEGDEEAQTELKARFDLAQQGKSQAERTLKLKTDTALRERFPRALTAWEKGYVNIPDGLDDTALADALRAEETKLADLGVPIETQVTQTTPVVEDGEGNVAVTVDPAQALSGGKAASSPGGAPRDLVSEYFQHLKGETIHDRAKANSILVELNKTRQHDKIRQITQQLEARPIMLDTI